MTAETIVLHGRKVVGGVAEGEALVTHETISGWGGVNAMQGTIIETRHELRGQSFKVQRMLVDRGRVAVRRSCKRGVKAKVSHLKK